MAYINPGQFIAPYLKPYGKQTVKHIPGIQQENRARDRLESLKPVWAEQVAESQQSQQIQRDAQARQMELLGYARSHPEAFENIVPPGMNPEMFFKGVAGDLLNRPTAQYPKALPPKWQTFERYFYFETRKFK